MDNNAITGMFDRLTGAPKRVLVGAALILLAIVAAADYVLGYAMTLGALYVFPVVLLSVVLSRGWVMAAAVLCAALRLIFNPPPTVLDLITSGIFAVLAYGLIGLFGGELLRSRKQILVQLDEIERQERLRLKAEQQLRLMSETSPAAILTVDGNGCLLSANRATRQLFGLPQDFALEGVPVTDYLPVLGEALKLKTHTEYGLRTAVQAQGRRHDGSLFLAQVWFSTWVHPSEGLRLAAIAVDASEELREREEQNQQNLRDSNRIIAGAVAHEVRNVCGAMGVAFSNLQQSGRIDAAERDFQTLGHLIRGLERLAVMELQGEENGRVHTGDLRDVLSHLRILLEPVWEEEGASIEWPEPVPGTLMVNADPFAMLQCFLNIAQNSLRAVIRNAGHREPRLRISLEPSGARIRIAFEDSGTGVEHPEELFQPFRSGSGKVGLGLYVSRALLRRHGGDLRYEPGRHGGARFVAEVPLSATGQNYAAITHDHNPAVAG